MMVLILMIFSHKSCSFLFIWYRLDGTLFLSVIIRNIFCFIYGPKEYWGRLGLSRETFKVRNDREWRRGIRRKVCMNENVSFIELWSVSPWSPLRRKRLRYCYNPISPHWHPGGIVNRGCFSCWLEVFLGKGWWIHCFWGQIALVHLVFITQDIFTSKWHSKKYSICSKYSEDIKQILSIFWLPLR